MRTWSLAAVLSLACTVVPAASPTPAARYGSCDRHGFPEGVVEASLSGIEQTLDLPFCVDDVSRNGSYVLGSAGGAVYTARLDGTELRRIMDAPPGFANATWAPDGAEIAFERTNGPCDLECTTEIWVVNADGSGARRIAEGGGPVWAPDSRRIAYEGPPPHGFAGPFLTVVSEDGSGKGILDPSGQSCPAWAPDGRSIVHTVGGVIYRVRADVTWRRGGTRRALAFGGCVVWSPNSDRVAFIGDKFGDAKQLQVVGFDGHPPRQLVRITGRDSEITALAWAPNGRLIAYARKKDVSTRGEELWTDHILTVPAKGGRAVVVADAQECSYVPEIRWFPDSRHVLYWRNEPGCAMDRAAAGSG